MKLVFTSLNPDPLIVIDNGFRNCLKDVNKEVYVEEYHLSETAETEDFKWGDVLEMDRIEDSDTAFSGISCYELRRYLTPIEHKRVLVVEDDVSQFGILEELINEINPNVVIDWEVGVNGAVNRINNAINSTSQDKNYDLVLSDVFLEDGDSGLELLEFCNSLNPKVECVLISAYSLGKIKSKNLEILDYIKKPIDFSVFYKKLAPMLKV